MNIIETILNLIQSSVGKKYIMAVTGFALVLFVLVHLLGNLQIFLGPDILNAYAHHLQSLPLPILWGFRIGLALCAIVHVITAIALTIENRKARPELYEANDYVQASYASRTMPMTGAILLLFILFHLGHFTVRVWPENYNVTIDPVPLAVHWPDMTPVHGHAEMVHDVYAMVISGFSVLWISIVYIVAMGLLALHLAHGVSSMFQSIGMRNHTWRMVLNCVATLYGWFVFLGYSSIPVAVLAGYL